MKNLVQALEDTWKFYTAHFYSLSMLILPFVFPIAALDVVVNSPEGKFFTWGFFMLSTISSVAYAIYQGAIILYISAALGGGQKDINNAFFIRGALKSWWCLWILYLFVGIAVTFGFLLLIVPGLIVLSRVMFAEFYCVLHKQKPLEAFSSSWKVSKPEQWLILSGIVIIFILTTVPFMVIEKVLFNDETARAASFLWWIFGALISPIYTIFAFRIFSGKENELNESV